MKLRRFVGETSRAVLEQVRAALGPDAMIVANKATAEGIEITALPGDAIDGLLDASAKPPAGRATSRASGLLDASAKPIAGRATSRASAAATDDDVRVSLTHRESRDESRTQSPPRPSEKGEAATAANSPGAAPRRRRDDPVPELAPPAPPLFADAGIGQRLAKEVAAMRTLLTEQMEQLTMTDAMKRSPLRARSLRELLQAGYSRTLARSLVQRLPDDFNPTQAHAWLTGVLARNLRCVTVEDELVTRGGVYALVGPTGVGKTTTTAKLAARCAVRYGAARLTLLTTDSYRVGAQDQLRVYARILGVTVQTISDRADLRQALDSARGKHLVLIDTVGMGQRDQRLAEHAALLAEPEVRRVLLLNAATQAETLDEVVCRYGQPGEEAATPFAGAIITKLDEAARLGPVLDVAIRHRLRLQCVTNGQRVPEDLCLARGDYLVGRSLRAAGKTTPFSFGVEELALLAAMPGAGHA